MPRRDDLNTILIIGSGPIAIGQGCEFDYSGVQACKALREEGMRIVLVNSNPATIMTDPEFSDRTYVEPITPATIRAVLEKEAAAGTPVDAVLPTLGGQTALNAACALWDSGDLEAMGVEMIGATRETIHRAEDRARFNEVCESIGLRTPTSRTVQTLEEAQAFLGQIELPAIIRPAFTLGGAGGGVAYNTAEFDEIVTRGLRLSMIGQVQIDRSLLGWKEYELEVIRDKRDNCIVVCSIENIDAMGVHTGDSITVAPAQTLTDKEMQALRDAAFAVIRAVGVETGGSNVQFAVNPNPENGEFEFVVVEMNPRVSRSSALASKATGYPIAKVATKLAIGYTLDELRNDVTGSTSACFEPSIDYVVTKMPRWTFEKFPEADETLTTQMKSVGEAMAIGRTFKESLQKVIRSMEVKRFGLGLDRNDKWLAARRAASHDGQGVARTADGQPIEWPIDADKLTRKLVSPSQGRLYYVRYALKMGWSIERISELSGYDPWYVDQIDQLVRFEDELVHHDRLEDVPPRALMRAKQLGYSDAQLSNLFYHTITSETILRVRAHRKRLGIEPVYNLVDTCAAEFEAVTPYYYSTYQPSSARVDERGELREAPPEDELAQRLRTDKKKVVILGGGPNRIGQGIEFDYCCVHAAFAAREVGFESVMINSNPETVSTDYDTSDLLFFEPLTLEDALNVIERLNDAGGDQVRGVVVQFGGQTPLNLAHGLERAGAPIIGTSLKSIDEAEDRESFDALLERMDLRRPPSGIARSLDEAKEIADSIGYPVLVRPSYVLGGRGMEICSDKHALVHYMTSALRISDLDDAPVLIDKFLDGAIEVDVDVVADFDPTRGPEDQPEGRRALVCGVMEHIEQAGVHSGDSTCTIPPWSLEGSLVDRIKSVSRELARQLSVSGLMNVQMAITQATGDPELAIIEVNPRASRTAPFVGKAKGVPWPRLAAKAMMGRSLAEMGVSEVPETGAFAVKAPVFPFAKFPGVDFVLGPEMRSTGEVMGMAPTLPIALDKAAQGAGMELPTEGAVFLSVRDADKPAIVGVARLLSEMGFRIYSTGGTAEALQAKRVEVRTLEKIAAGARPNVIDLMADGEISLVINTPTRTGWKTDEGRIRAAAVRLGLPMITTATGALAAVKAIHAERQGGFGVQALQDYFADGPAAVTPSQRRSAGV